MVSILPKGTYPGVGPSGPTHVPFDRRNGWARRVNRDTYRPLTPYKPNPKFGPRTNRKGATFGKRMPLGIWGPGTPARWKFGPWGWALSGAGTIATYLLYQPGDWAQALTDAQFQKCCDTGGNIDVYGHSFTNTSGCGTIPSGLCNTGGQVYQGTWPASIPTNRPPPAHENLGAVLRLGQYDPNPDRCTWKQEWRRPNKSSGAPAFPDFVIPLDVTIPMSVPLEIWGPPALIPAILPEYYPEAPPIWPGTTPRTQPQPAPAVSPTPVGVPIVVAPGPIVPAVTITPDPLVPILPDIHIQEPPKTPDKEKKKRLTQAQTQTWLKILEQTTSSFMELDDFISALYKAIPWQLRRWRGRDGIWRDRDHNTLLRTQRIYEYLGDVSISKMIDYMREGAHNVAMNELEDKFYGKIGQALSDKAKELGYKGLWAGSGGFQRGGAIMRKEQWEAYKELKRAEFAKAYKQRYYYVKRYVLGVGWVKERRPRPITQIPWYRQRSLYNKYYTDWTKGGSVGTVRPRYFYHDGKPGPRIPKDWPEHRGYT